MHIYIACLWTTILCMLYPRLIIGTKDFGGLPLITCETLSQPEEPSSWGIKNIGKFTINPINGAWTLIRKWGFGKKSSRKMYTTYNLRGLDKKPNQTPYICFQFVEIYYKLVPHQHNATLS